MEEHYRIVKQEVPAKMKWLLDLTLCTQFEKDTMEILEARLPEVCRALAIVTTHPCSKIVASYFIRAANPAHIPVKLFFDEESALRWLATK